MTAQYEKLADFIIQNIGGIENIDSLTHCSASLRFILNDASKVKTEKLRESPEVITIVQSDNQYQVVLGPSTLEIYALIDEKIKSISKESTRKAKKKGIGSKFIDTVSSIFAPILMILSAAGLIKGLLSLFVFLGWITDGSGTYTILYTLADGFFYFMPIFLGYTAAKKFDLDPFLGMAIGAALCYPTIVALGNEEAIMTLFTGTVFESSVYTTFLGLPVVLPAGGYVSTVIPVILAVALAKPVDSFFNKIIPDVVKGFLVPVCCLLIVVPLTFLVVGPIAAILSSIIESFAEYLYNLSPIIEGAFIGGLWQILVIGGLHWVLVPIMLFNLASQGYDAFLQGFFPVSFAQTAVVFAIYLKTKDKALKEIALPATISGFFGITEPAILGVTLPRIKYFIASCVAAAIGGGIIGLMHVRTYVFGGMGIFSYPGYISPDGDISSMIGAIVASGVAFALGFIYTYIFYKDNATVNNEELSDIE